MIHLQQVPPQPAPGDLPVPPPIQPPEPVTDPTQDPPPIQDPDVVDPMPDPTLPPIIA